MRIIFTQILILTLLTGLNAQIWNWASDSGGVGADIMSAMKIDETGKVLFAGSYSGEASFGTESLEAVAGRDACLVKLDESGNFLWAVSGGSSNNDLSIDVEVDEEGSVIWLGQYWVEGFFESDTIYSGTNAKAYFVAKYTVDGTFLWVKSINGSSTKVVSDLTVDENNDIYLTGYFNDSLVVADVVLNSVAEEDAFVLKMSEDGEALWGETFGNSGIIRPQRIDQTSTGDLVLAGQLTGSVEFATDSLVSVTTDFDLFVALLNSDGVPVWGLIGTGVSDNLVRTIEIDESDNIYLSGGFEGVLTIGGETILTPGFKDNLYLLKLSEQGDLVWARGLNDQVFNEESSAFDIVIQGLSILMVGQFEEQLIIDDLELNGIGLESFIAAFSKESGIVEKLSRVSGGALTSINQVEVDELDRLHVGGAFFESITLTGMALDSEGSADLLVAQASGEFTDVAEPLPIEGDVRVFPNPIIEWLNLNPLQDNFEIEVFDVYGRVAFTTKNKRHINLGFLVAGTYWLHYRDENFSKIISFIKI